MSEAEQQGVYFGIDIGEKSTLVSYYQLNMPEPDTVSTVMGSEVYTMPTMLARRSDGNQWYIGHEAKQMISLGKATAADQLFIRAIQDADIVIDGEKFTARELLYIYIRKLLEAPGRFYNQAPLEKLVFTVDNTDANVAEMFSMVAGRLELNSTQWMVIDHRQAFYYYAFSQEEQRGPKRNIMLYDFEDRRMHSCLLTHSTSTTPYVVNMENINQGDIMTDKDKAFLDIAMKTLPTSDAGVIYLTGDGFDGQWLKESLQYICDNRRVFMGKNLYSKGACYAGAVRDGKRPWNYIYVGDQEMKMSISLKVISENKPYLYSMITAGDSWYNARGEVEVILDGKAEVAFHIQPPNRHDASIETVELTDMPLRPTRTTRLRISAVPVSDRSVRMTIKDLGFGEIYKSSGLSWNYDITLPDADSVSDAMKELGR